jgi:heptosyltransferase-2
MALPTIEQLRRSGFLLRLIGRKWAKDLLAGLQLPIATVPHDMRPTTRILRTLGIGRCLLLTNSLSSALAMRMAGVKSLGYRGDWRRVLLSSHTAKLSGCHEVESFWHLGRCAVAAWGHADANWPDAPPTLIQLPTTNADRASAAKALAHARINGPYIVCCPMAVGNASGRSKRWPMFADFCRVLSARGAKLVICPGPGEETECESFSRDANILPGLSLGVYAAVLAGAELVVANDSGPMHMAAAVGTPVIGVFGFGDPQRTRPWGGQFVGGIDGWPSLDTVLAVVEQTIYERRLPARAA